MGAQDNVRLKRGAVLAAVLALLVACATPSGGWTSPSAVSGAPLQPEIATGVTRKADVVTQKFAVAAANPLATQAGFEMLKAGGSAVDAAIAVQMVLGLVEPQSSGLGGGAFLLHSTAGDGATAVFARRIPNRFASVGV